MSTVSVQADNKNIWMGGESPFKISYGKLMMWYFLMSDAFTFGAFLISYGTTRFANTIWPDSNEVFKAFPWMSFFQNNLGMFKNGAPLVFVSFMTFVLIVSSVTMVLAVHEGHCMNRKGVIKWMIWTIIGGSIFLSCQAWEWMHLHEEGAWWGSFITENQTTESFQHFFRHNLDPNLIAAHGGRAIHDFFNFFFTITGFHGFHVFSGVLFLIIILFNVINGTYERRGHYEMVEKVGLYWHFVDLVWVFVFTCFYLL
jgi:cytochrome c oxidase subunit III